MKIRVGLSHVGREVLDKCASLSAPLLISANSLWDDKRQKFGRWKCFQGFDVALDSGGFVAMQLYGRYRYKVADYVALAGAMRPAWWAQMDFCCEKELAPCRSDVWERITLTVGHLQECQRVAAGEGVPAPMPVLQGWLAEDYIRGPAFDDPFTWPGLVGVGSVCRRQLHGPAGVMAILEALDSKVPAHVRFHLFGVKSEVLVEVAKYWPARVESIDSMAWHVHASRSARKAGVPCCKMRAPALEQWYNQQAALANPKQLVFHW